MAIQAIETLYNGNRFRSRLEARWAVFFDLIGIEYRYEAQGYEMSGIRYLPDFQLLDDPGMNGYGDMVQHPSFVEIKPYAPTRQEWNKAVLLACGSQRPVYIFSGDIGLDVEIFGIDPSIMGSELPEFLINIPAHALDKTIAMPPYEWAYAYWMECVRCGKIDLINQWLIDLDGVGKCVHCGCEEKDVLTGTSKTLLSAYDAARSARFEHGETPKYLRGKLRNK